MFKKRERETTKPPANNCATLFSNCIWRCLNVIKMCAVWGQIRLHPHTQKKKNWWESTGDAVSFKRMRGGWGGDSDEKEEGEKEKTRGEDSDSSSLWVSLHGLCQEKQGPSKVGNLISAESCGRKRCSSGGRGADPQPWSTPKIFSPQNTSVSSSLKSLYVSPSVPFWPPGQDHSLSSGLCIFSDFPGYSSVQGQKS